MWCYLVSVFYWTWLWKNKKYLIFIVLLHKQNYILAEAYYATKDGKVKGILTVTEHLIMFDPIRAQENESFVNIF
jgi:hypothetical protein